MLTFKRSLFDLNYKFIMFVFLANVVYRKRKLLAFCVLWDRKERKAIKAEGE